MFCKPYFLFLNVVILITQRSFAGGKMCNCWCPNTGSNVCDVLDALQTAEDINRGERVKWENYFGFLEKLHRDWEADLKQEQRDGSENLSKRILEVERQNEELQEKMSGVGVMLLAAEDRVAMLEADLQNERNSRIEMENKMADFERKLQSVLYQTEKSETHLKKEIEARMGMEEEMLQNFSKVITSTQQQNVELQTKMSAVEAKLYAAENLAVNLQSELHRGKEAMTLFELDLLGNFSIAMSIMENRSVELLDTISTMEGNLNYTSLRAEILQFFLVKVLAEIRDFKEQTFLDFSEKISANENRSVELQFQVANIEERLQLMENQSFGRRSVDAEKNAMEEPTEDFKSKRDKYESSSERYNSRLITEMKRPIREIEKNESDILMVSEVTEIDEITEEPNITESLTEQVVTNSTTNISETDELILRLHGIMYEVEERLIRAETKIKSLDIDLKLEKNAREIFEVDIAGNFSNAMTLVKNTYLELEDTIIAIKDTIEERFNSEIRRTTILELGLRDTVQKILR